MKENSILPYILISFLLIAISFGCGYLFRKPVTVKEEVVRKEIVRDTTIFFKEHYNFCNIPTPLFYSEHDTLMVRDTVYIKDVPELYEFKEQDYDLKIYATHLHNYTLDIHKDIPFKYTTTETTVRTTRNKVLHFGPQVGFGYGVFNRKPDLYVGVGLNINL